MLESCGVVALRQMDRRCSLSWQWRPFIRGPFIGWTVSRSCLLFCLEGIHSLGVEGSARGRGGRTRAWLAQTRPNLESNFRARITVLPAGAPIHRTEPQGVLGPPGR